MNTRWFGVCCLAYALFVGQSKAQSIELTLERVPLKEAFSVLNERYGFHFVYLSSAIEELPPVSLRVHRASIANVMDLLVQGLPLSYSINGRVVTVVREQEWGRRMVNPALMISGQVMDAETSQGIPNVSIQYITKPGGGITLLDGTFQLTVPPGVDSIRWTAMGYQAYTAACQAEKPYLITLERLLASIDEVVITGIVERNRSQYTSSTATFTGVQLKQLSNRDLIGAISSLDPSFVIIPNYRQGSNPNALGQVELRGKTSLTTTSLHGTVSSDPNLPLFVLDGFESSLQQIIDLDINRIASVTLLKDAASAALYGAQSANGVIVVETLKPHDGKWQFAYTSDLALEQADLGDYNMMSAAEKLEFERLAGRYKAEEGNIYVDRLGLDRAYNDRLRKVLQGIDYNWLKMPLQKALMHNQSLYVQGGNTALQYGLGGNYRERAGVMKGSGRNTWSAYADVAYRKGDWQVLAKTNYFGHRGFGVPSANFADFAMQSPYYTPSDTAAYFGDIPYPDGFGGSYRETNYVYNALLNSYAVQRTNSYLHNLTVMWRPANDWQVIGRFQLSHDVAKVDTFWSPKDTRYTLANARERGEYLRHESKGRGYQGSVMAVWNRALSEKQFLTLNVRTEVMEMDVNDRGFSLVGFPDEATGRPQEAYRFADHRLERMPSSPMIRRVNALVSTNYSWDARYLMDATLRVDGSTQFGSANRYATFWSVGLGWNLHREAFMNDRWKGLSILRLRANTGLTGNQSFGSFASTVSYWPIGQQGGIAHESLGNPFLEWQKTRQTNIGLDVELWEGKISLTANVFEKVTHPLIAYMDLPPSTGVVDYALNVGDLRLRGVEWIFRFSPIYQPGGNWMWTIGLTGMGYSSRFENLSAAMEDANEQLQAVHALHRYRNGYSPDDLWAVRSLGIDPDTGKERFLTREGEETFTYSIQDEVKVGNQRPWLEGVFSCYVTYKQLHIGGYLRYSLAASRLNEALYQKVENIGFDDLGKNQDQRALHERWQQPGDQATFKGISLLEETPMSSRFLQRESFFSGEALSVGYLWDTDGWLLRTGLQSIQLTGYAKDFFRKSNVLAERGIAYPFSRSFALSLKLIL